MLELGRPGPARTVSSVWHSQPPTPRLRARLFGVPAIMLQWLQPFPTITNKCCARIEGGIQSNWSGQAEIRTSSFLDTREQWVAIGLASRFTTPRRHVVSLKNTED